MRTNSPKYKYYLDPYSILRYCCCLPKHLQWLHLPKQRQQSTEVSVKFNFDITLFLHLRYRKLRNDHSIIIKKSKTYCINTYCGFWSKQISDATCQTLFVVKIWFLWYMIMLLWFLWIIFWIWVILILRTVGINRILCICMSCL